MLGAVKAWQLAFFIVGLPGILVGLLIWLTLVFPLLAFFLLWGGSVWGPVGVAAGFVILALVYRLTKIALGVVVATGVGVVAAAVWWRGSDSATPPTPLPAHIWRWPRAAVRGATVIVSKPTGAAGSGTFGSPPQAASSAAANTAVARVRVMDIVYLT